MATTSVRSVTTKQNAAREYPKVSSGSLILYGVISLIVSVLSGVGGGGGGLITTPLGIFLGLSPAQSVAVGKFGGFASAVGTLRSMKSHSIQNKRLYRFLVVTAVVIGISVPFAIKSIDANLYKNLVGVFLVVISVYMLVKKFGYETKVVSKKNEIIGLIGLVIGYTLVALFSSGLGVIINLAMMGPLGMSAIDTLYMKRSVTLIMNIFLMIGVTLAGLVVWKFVVVGFVSSITGAYVGGKIAIKKGSEFIAKIMAVLALLSGVGLILV